MQIQQLRYLIAVAEEGSFRAAANKLYVSQSSVSVAIKDLEQETGVEVFRRTSRGTTLTAEGAELLDYARSIIEQVDLMEARYARSARGMQVRFAVSSQHYSLVVDAFADFAASHADPHCEFMLRESYTNQIIRDVQERRSELGVIYLSNYNDRVIRRALDAAELEFSPLYTAQPHVIVRQGHPLASKRQVAIEDLAGYYRIVQDQGLESSSYFAEEPLSAVPSERRIVVTDNATLCSMLANADGYALGTGAFIGEDNQFASIPIATDETMNVGYIHPAEVPLGTYAREFLELLEQRIAAS